MAEGPNLVGSLKMLAVLVGIYLGLKVVLFIGLLIVGSVANVAISGDVDVPAAINTALGTQVTSTASQYGKIDTGITFVFSLLSLAIIIQMFWGMLKDKLGGKDKPKSGSGNTGGFMG
jgi:hypothetical protein